MNPGQCWGFCFLGLSILFVVLIETINHLFYTKHLQTILVGLFYRCRNKRLDKTENQSDTTEQKKSSGEFEKIQRIGENTMPNLNAQNEAARKALEAARNAVAQAETLFTMANADEEQKTQYNRRATDRTETATQSKRTRSQRPTTSQSSAGRIASPEQQEIREEIRGLIKDGKLQLFTIKGLTTALEKDRIQVRNAINYLETQGEVIRYAEKINPEGTRGNREILYIPANFESPAVA